MEIIKDLLLIVIPSSMVFGTVYYVLTKFFENEDRKRLAEARRESSSAVIPVRLQAYERMILFLERISPESLVMRMHKKSMPAREFQTELLQTIRSEFEHNIAQQMYISNAGWELTKRAKEEMIQLVNLAASRTQENQTSLDMSRMIFGLASELEKLPTQVAIDYLKKEIRQSF